MGLGSFFKGLGKAALKVAPFAAYAIPGVGPIAGAAIQAGLGAANAKVSGGGLKDILLGAGTGAGAGALGGGLGKGLSPTSGGLKGTLGNIAKQTGKNVLTSLGSRSSLMPGESGGMPTGIGEPSWKKWLDVGTDVLNRRGTTQEDEKKKRRQRSPIGPTEAIPRMDQTRPNLAFPLLYGREEALGRTPKYPPYVSYLD